MPFIIATNCAGIHVTQLSVSLEIVIKDSAGASWFSNDHNYMHAEIKNTI